MRRVLGAAAIAALALTGLTGTGASADGPLNCNHPWYYKPCTAVNAAYAAVTDVGPAVECNHPWYSGLCETINDLIGDGGR
jgi:hypothetical protein